MWEVTWHLGRIKINALSLFKYLSFKKHNTEYRCDNYIVHEISYILPWKINHLNCKRYSKILWKCTIKSVTSWCIGIHVYIVKNYHWLELGEVISISIIRSISKYSNYILILLLFLLKQIFCRNKLCICRQN